MKTKTLLLLASIAVLTTIARASSTDNDVVVLPTYTVEAPRYTAVEKQINASLDEVRQLAKAPLAVPAECAALKAVAKEGSMVARQASEKMTVQLAKS